MVALTFNLYSLFTANVNVPTQSNWLRNNFEQLISLQQQKQNTWNNEAEQ